MNNRIDDKAIIHMPFKQSNLTLFMNDQESIETEEKN